jgi:hypothetical protein
MSHALFILVPLAGLALQQVRVAPKASIIGPIDSVVMKSAGKSVPAVQALKQPLGLLAGPKLLSAAERVATLKALSLDTRMGSAAATTLNLTVLNPAQTVNGVSAYTNYLHAGSVYSDSTPGVAFFGNSTTMYNGAGSDPTLYIRFKPVPNKKYLIDAGMAGNNGTYYIHVQVDNGNAFQQIMPNTNRLLIVFPGTAKPQQSYIAIRGSIPALGIWAWYGCQITEI